MQQAAIGDCLSFDPFPFDQYGLTAAEVDVGGRQIADAFVIAQVIVVSDEGLATESRSIGSPDFSINSRKTCVSRLALLWSAFMD